MNLTPYVTSLGRELLTAAEAGGEDGAALVERLTAEPPPAEVVAALVDRTGGNPFYTTELVRLIGSEHRRQRSARGDHLDAVTFYWVVHTRQGS